MFCNNKIIVAILSYWACTLFDQTIQKKNGQEDGLNIKDLNPEAGLILNKAKKFDDHQKYENENTTRITTDCVQRFADNFCVVLELNAKQIK